jgi:DNA modification methylase
MLEMNKIYLGDCLKIMPEIPDKSIDLIITDLPYQQTARNTWDKIIPFQPLWFQYERIIKDKGTIVLFANGMFTAELMMSNKKMWRYNLIWNKVMASGHLNANRMPLRSHEDICLFYKELGTFNPQFSYGEPIHGKGKSVNKKCSEISSKNTNYNDYKVVPSRITREKYPTSILKFQKRHPSLSVHPTEKSLALCDYLIRTYSNKGEIVLDSCCGSGTTLLASIETERNFIGIELEKSYYDIAFKRVKDKIESPNLFNRS